MSWSGAAFLALRLHEDLVLATAIDELPPLEVANNPFGNDVFKHAHTRPNPLAPVIDVRSTGHFIPTYVLIVEWGKTNIEVLEQALGHARTVREKLLGVVLNKADTTLLKRYEGYGTDYYYHPNYSPRVDIS